MAASYDGLAQPIAALSPELSNPLHMRVGLPPVMITAAWSQIYTEAMASERCEAIHLTRVGKDFDCDTFMPALDPARYRLWSATPPRRDNGVRTAFLCYTRAGAPTPRLPKALASRHDELQVCSWQQLPGFPCALHPWLRAYYIRRQGHIAGSWVSCAQAQTANSPPSSGP